MERQFESARQFSKEKMQAERRQAAEVIHFRRKEYFSRQESIQRQLRELVTDAEAKKIKAAEARGHIETFKAELEKSSKNFITRLLDRRRIKQLQGDIGIAKIDENVITEELAELEDAKISLEQSLRDRTALDEARQELDRFYQKNEQAWNDYQDDREAGNVKTVMRERGALIVHTFINPTLSPSDENGLMRKELSWRDKLDILALEPTLSASAVDQEHKDTFAPVGVLLGDGQVEVASSRDIGSRTIDQKTRSGPRFSLKERVRNQITEALAESKGGWTEFVVAHPKVAGLFFRLDSEDMGKNIEEIREGSDASIPEIATVAKERNLPLFVLRGGKFYDIGPDEAAELCAQKETEYTEKVGPNRRTHKLTVYPKLNLNEDRLLTANLAADLKAGISDAEKEMVFERLMTDSPFQLRRFPEAVQVLSRAEGRAAFYLFGRFKPETDGQKAVIPTYAAGNTRPIEVSIIKTIPGPTHLEHYVRLDDGTDAIWRQSRNPVSEESRFYAGSMYRQDRLNGRERAPQAGYVPIIAERLETITDVIDAAAKSVHEISGYVQKWESERAGIYADQWKEKLKCIAAFLYGIAEEASAAGENKIADQAKESAAKVTSFEEYQSLIARRVSENGTFKITKEELLGK